MTAVLLGQFEHDSEEWLAARDNRLGGSEVAAVVGLSKWESRLSLWHRKRGELPQLDLNEEMEWGQRLESAIAAKFADEHPHLRIQPGGTFTHKDRPWQLANPDLLLDGTLLEVKTADRDDLGWGPDGSDVIPVYYLCQVLWYLDVFGFDHAWVAVLIGGKDYREYQIRADPDEQMWLREHGWAFMQSIWADERPELDSHAATYEAVRTLHPDIDRDGTVDLDPTLALDWHAKAAARKHAETEEREAKTRILDAMGDARRGLVDGRPTTIRVPSKGGPPHLRTSRRNPIPIQRKALK